MMIKDIYNIIRENCNQNELETFQLVSYHNGNYVRLKPIKDNLLCLNLKIKENRLDYFLELLDNNHIEYEELLKCNYYYIINVGSKEDKNHIVFDYVINSHVIIPQNILQRFGYKKNGWRVNYISYPYSKIAESKIKEYGAEYGYYDMQIEKEIEKRYESKMGEFTKKLNDWQKNKIEEIPFDEDLIHSIFDMAIYRNPETLHTYNDMSLVSKILGNVTPSQFISFAFSHKFPHLFVGLKANIIVNDTSNDFIINKSMISTIICDDEEVVIIPVIRKVCIALIRKEFYKRLIKNNKLSYMYIDDPEQIDIINERIFEYAKFRKEDVIGSLEELEKILKNRI